MSVDLTKNFLRLLVHFRRHDLENFIYEHRRLYSEAEKEKDYGNVTAHYYSVMSKVIDEYFNGNFHFVPPPSPSNNKNPIENSPLEKISLEDALRILHLKIGECLSLSAEKSCVDIGCGIGGVMEDLAETGAQLTGITIAPNEVEIGNARFQKLKIHNKCWLLEGDCQQTIPLKDAFYDSAYAIYALKYFPDLSPILREIARILKPNGLFLIYDLVKTDKYDEINPEHRQLLEGIEYACGMPSLHSRNELIEFAEIESLKLIKSIDLTNESGQPFYYCFTSSTIFMWLIRSPFIKHLIKAAELLRILPKGFAFFNEIFLAGTVDKIVRAGEAGILSGAEILLFQKQ